MRLHALLAALPLFAAIPALAQQGPPPGAFKMVETGEPAGHKTIPLYPNAPAEAAPEQWMSINGDAVARNVTQPTVEAFLPDPKKATGAAVIVAPGGAFYMLSMKTEGWDVAKWLAAHGIAAFVLKYRVETTPRDLPGMQMMAGKRLSALFGPRSPGDVDVAHFQPAVADAQAALKLIRARAAEWKIDPARVGMIGFSAGAMTTLDTTLASDPAAVPNFAAAIYPPMNTAKVPANAAPLFVAIAADDGLFGGRGFGLIQSWQDARRPVEFHMYEKGDHGFGTGKPGTTTVLVMEEFRLWLETRDLLGTKK